MGLFGLLLLGVSTACKKGKKLASLQVEELNSPTSLPIHKCVWLDASTGFICGGKKNTEGFIYKTIDTGNSWQLIQRTNGTCIYDIKFVNDTIAYCCGDDLLLMKSKDNGNTWSDVSFANVTLESFNHTPLRCIFGNFNLLMVVGGENYHNGNALWFENDQIRWVWHFDHEFRTGLNFEQKNFVLAGYGNTYRTTDHGYNYTPMDLDEDFFTGSSTINSNTGYACGYDGGIYRTDDGGHQWQTLLKTNKSTKKRIHFNGIYFTNMDHGWAVGNEGLVMSCEDGRTFTEYRAISKNDLLSVCKDKLDRFVISASDGKLYRIKK